MSDCRICFKHIQFHVSPLCLNIRAEMQKAADMADIQGDFFTGPPPKIAEKLI